MARAAGDGKNYTLAVVNTAGKVVNELGGVPSVTTIIGATDASKVNALSGWAYNQAVAGVCEIASRNGLPAGIGEDALKKRLRDRKLTPWHKRDSSAQRGTGIHDLAERLLLGTADYDDVLSETPADRHGYAQALIAWHKQYDRTPIALESVLVSLDHKYAGTVDLIDTDNGGETVTVCDYKTSKGIYESQLIQCTAYAMAWEEQTARMGNPQRVSHVAVIRFGADGKFEDRVEPYTGASKFLAMRALYKELEGE